MNNHIFNKPWPEKFEPKAEEYTDIVATSLGGIFCDNYLLRKSLYAYPYSFVKGAALSLGSCLKRPPKKYESTAIPAFIHSQWSRGYFHWLTESLPRALSAVEAFPDCVILLPKSYNSFHKETLEMLGVKYDYFTDHNIKVDRCVITSCPDHYGTTSNSFLIDLKNKLVSNVSSNVKLGRRLYISRRKARGRTVINENEVINLLSEFGFEEIIPEDYTFDEQVSIFSQVDILVSIHGAGLTNMLFMKEGSSVIELLPRRNGVFDFRVNSLTFKHDNCYISLAKSLSIKYNFLQCGHDKGRYAKTHMSNLHVNCTELLHTLGHLGLENN